MSNDHVQVQITVDNVGITRQGFGKPLIVSHSDAIAPDLYREYSSLLAVAEDFDSDTPEYLAANAFFAQTPKPPKIAVGRAPSQPTQQYTIRLGAGGPRNEFTYSIDVAGTGMESETVSYTSDEDASDDEIMTGIAAALNDKDDKTYTAVLVPGASDPTAIEVTADDPGVWFSLCLGNVSALSIGQTHDDPADLADNLSDILLEDASWYEVHTNFNSPDYVKTVAEWVAGNERIYVFDVNETDCITTTVDLDMGTDTGSQMAALGYSSSMGCYHPCPEQMFAAAWMGRWLPTTPGQATAKFKTLEGVETVALTDTHKNNLRARRMNSYETVYQRAITWEGTVFSTVYKFLDVRRNVDWLTDEIQKEVFGILAGSDIVPYTPAGVARVEGAVRGRMKFAETRGVLAPDSSAVEAPEFEDINPSDKSDRVLRDIKASGTLAGAIHAVIPIDVTVTF